MPSEMRRTKFSVGDFVYSNIHNHNLRIYGYYQVCETSFRQIRISDEVELNWYDEDFFVAAKDVFSLDDPIIYLGWDGNHNAWHLRPYGRYKIVDFTFENQLGPNNERHTTIFYKISKLDGRVITSWFRAENFITEKEYRKRKLLQLNECASNI